MNLAHALSITATGMQVFEQNLAVKAANLTGAGVDGFKALHLVATDLPSDSTDLPGTPTSATGTIRPIGLQVGLGAKVVGTYRDFSKGDLVNTGNELSVAINGRGFYQVQMPDGTTAYTRASSFQLAPDGTIVTTEGGHKVLPGIVVPATADSLEINNVGQVYITLSGQSSAVLLGQFQLANFINPSGLISKGGGFYSQTDASGTPTLGFPGSDNFGTLLQGFREGSNINSVQEITDLIQIEKGFGFLTKVLNTADAMSESMKGIGRS